MTPNIEIRYRHIPSEITDDIQKDLERANLTVSIVHDKKEYFNFTGGPADILIYIDNHLTEIIIGGLLLPAAYDTLKYSIKTTWKKLVLHYGKRKSELEEDKNHIELNFKLHENKTIEFNLSGDIDEKTINNVVDKLFEYLKDKEKHNNDFQNKDYKDRLDLKPRIRMRYNPNTNKWEPTNFAEIKKQLDDLMRRAEEEFDN